MHLTDQLLLDFYLISDKPLLLNRSSLSYS